MRAGLTNLDVKQVIFVENLGCHVHTLRSQAHQSKTVCACSVLEVTQKKYGSNIMIIHKLENLISILIYH
jgi:hypothetical protein